MTTKYLRVRNWSKFQHYRHRSPPWIKLHRSLLNDYHFQSLPDSIKCQVILIWLFAAERGGYVENDQGFLRQRLGLKRGPDLKFLIEQGFLIESASIELAQGSPRVRVEESRLEESREKPVDKSIDMDKVAKNLSARFTQKTRG